MLIQYVCYSIFTSVSLTRSLSLSFHISPLPFFAAANKEEIKFGTYKKKTAKEKKKTLVHAASFFRYRIIHFIHVCVCECVCMYLFWGFHKFLCIECGCCSCCGDPDDNDNDKTKQQHDPPVWQQQLKFRLWLEASHFFLQTHTRKYAYVYVCIHIHCMCVWTCSLCFRISFLYIFRKYIRKYKMYYRRHELFVRLLTLLDGERGMRLLCRRLDLRWAIKM